VTGDVKAVPVGKYAKDALGKLGSWQAAAPKFAMTENVPRGADFGWRAARRR
jgi:molybdate transport system substrate-binding protein